MKISLIILFLNCYQLLKESQFILLHIQMIKEKKVASKEENHFERKIKEKKEEQKKAK